jgi:ATP-binding cassette subfamily F protein 3
MQECSEQLSQIEVELTESELYEHQQKSRLAQLLEKQQHLKASLENAEVEWMDGQESIDTLQDEFDNANAK